MKRTMSSVIIRGRSQSVKKSRTSMKLMSKNKGGESPDRVARKR